MLDRDFVEIKEELERLYKKVDKVLGNYDRVGYEMKLLIVSNLPELSSSI